MHDIFTPQSLVDFLYFNPESNYDDQLLNDVFSDSYLLDCFERVAEQMLSDKGFSCEPSAKALLMIDQMAALHISRVNDRSATFFNS